jgi:hypothetical protein
MGATDPAHTCISTSGLQNCDGICFKTFALLCLVMTVTVTKTEGEEEEEEKEEGGRGAMAFKG